MARVDLRWSDRDLARPALDVLVRLVALTDNAFEAGALDDFLMRPGADGSWVWEGDVPDGFRSAYQICPVRDRPLRGHPVDEARWQQVIALGEPDPAADDTLPAGCTFGAGDQPASVLSMPGAPPQPWARRRGREPAAVTDRLALAHGGVAMVQAPADREAPSALVVLFDGVSMQTIGVPETIANLQSDGIVGPVTAVYVESIRGSAPRGPSRVQSLTDRSELATFVIEELVPALERNYVLDARPERRALAGHSLGGLAALHVAALAPEVFGAVGVGSAALW